MIIIGYLILAVIVMGFSIQLSNYVDIIDKRTSISGAFIGGVILAAITSLPELFTSISATALLGQPELVIGNILGSDIFTSAGPGSVPPTTCPWCWWLPSIST